MNIYVTVRNLAICGNQKPKRILRWKVSSLDMDRAQRFPRGSELTESGKSLRRYLFLTVVSQIIQTKYTVVNLTQKKMRSIFLRVKSALVLKGESYLFDSNKRGGYRSIDLLFRPQVVSSQQEKFFLFCRDPNASLAQFLFPLSTAQRPLLFDLIIPQLCHVWRRILPKMVSFGKSSFCKYRCEKNGSRLATRVPHGSLNSMF